MLPLMMGVGIATAATGAYFNQQGARQQANAQKQIAQDEMKQNQLRQQGMELDARRKQLEVLRNAQRARAMGLTAATGQGAQYGSGLQGGYGQISGDASTSLTGIQQGLDLGRQNFQLSNDISQWKMNAAHGATTSALGQGISSVGGAIMGGASSMAGGLSGLFSGTPTGGAPAAGAYQFGGTGSGLR